MDRVAVFVDAGYLFAQGSKEISGRQLRRREISLDHQTLIRLLKDFAENVSGLPLLRIHWHDGTSQGPTSQHNTLADQADMKVRLGFMNSAGQQKGVDSLIVTDMISLARNRAMADCQETKISGSVSSRPRNTGCESIFSESDPHGEANPCFFSGKWIRRTNGTPGSFAHS